MKIILSMTDDSANVMNKTLRNPLELDIIIRKGFDFNNPTFIFNSDITANIQKYNYYEIPDMKLKGMINSVVNDGGATWIMKGETDVLETFKEAILKSKFRYNRKLDVGDYQDLGIGLTLNSSLTKKYFNSGIESDKMLILTTVGITNE